MSLDAKRPLTLRDVSEASGVSEMTVSRVLRNRGDVSEKTREKVLAAAKELGYVPNKIAGALASKRVNLVAVVIPSLSNMVFPEVLTGINQILEDTELQPVVGVTDYRVSSLPERFCFFFCHRKRPNIFEVRGFGFLLDLGFDNERRPCPVSAVEDLFVVAWCVLPLH